MLSKSGNSGYHERKAVIPADCAKALKAWLNIRPQSDETALFVNVHGCRLTRDGLYKIVRRTGERTGINRNVFVHLCRHTMATLMLRSGVPITDVSLQLGHRNLSSTLVYLHGDISSLKESVDKKFKY